jgi:hypothetical protein
MEQEEKIRLSQELFEIMLQGITINNEISERTGKLEILKNRANSIAKKLDPDFDANKEFNSSM